MHPTDPGTPFIAGIVAALALGSLVRLAALHGAAPERRRRRLDSLRSWWVVGLLLCLGIAGGMVGLTVILALASCLAIVEYLELTGLDKVSRSARRSLLSLSILHYASIAAGVGFAVVWPLAGLAVVSIMELLTSSSMKHYLQRVSGLSWGALVLVFGLSHALLPFSVPVFADGPAGPLGWVIYLILLTEINDIAQALTGRTWGRHKRHRITPTISPNKTWEGFIGGLVVTTIAAIALAPAMTDLADGPGLTGLLPALLAGIVVGISGFLGDINMSAVKRDAGVKDSGHLLPGIGGIVDRVDSLSWSAPALVYYVLWLKSPGGAG